MSTEITPLGKYCEEPGLEELLGDNYDYHDHSIVDFKMEISERFEDRPYRFARWIYGTIRIDNYDDNSREKIVGEMKMCWIQTVPLSNETNGHVRAILDYNSSCGTLADVWDAVYDENCNYHSQLVTIYDEHLCGQLEERRDILYLEKIAIKPEFRGHGFGQWAIAQAVEVFGGNCGFVALKPFALDYDQHFRGDREGIVGNPSLDKEIEVAFARVEKFYEQLGFRQLPKFEGKRSDYWVYCPPLAREGFDQPPVTRRKLYRINRHSCEKCGKMRAFNRKKLCETCETNPS